jgi:hypothetical protein
MISYYKEKRDMKKLLFVVGLVLSSTNTVNAQQEKVTPLNLTNLHLKCDSYIVSKTGPVMQVDTIDCLTVDITINLKRKTFKNVTNLYDVSYIKKYKIKNVLIKNDTLTFQINDRITQYYTISLNPAENTTCMKVEFQNPEQADHVTISREVIYDYSTQLMTQWIPKS